MARSASRKGHVRVRFSFLLLSIAFARSLTLASDAQAATAVTNDPSSLPSTRLAQNYAVVLQASGGSGGFVWMLASGQLPPGLVLGSSSGTIHGVGSATGRFTFSVKAADATDATNSAVRTL